MGRTEECRRKAEDLLGWGGAGGHRVGTKAPRLRPAPGGGGEEYHCGELGAGDLEELMQGAQSWVALPPSFTQ